MKHFPQAIEALQNRLSADSYARTHVGRIATAAKALRETQEARAGEHPTQHAARLDKMSKQFAAAVQTARTEIDKAEAGGRGALNQAFAERVGLTADRYAANVIDSFSKANSKTRHEMLAQIVAQGDGRSLAALMEAPRFTHGVDPDTLDKYRTTLEQQHTPDIFEKRKQFEADTETAKAVLSAADGLAVEITKATTDESLAAGARLEAAQQVFNEATG